MCADDVLLSFRFVWLCGLDMLSLQFKVAFSGFNLISAMLSDSGTGKAGEAGEPSFVN